ncbi:ABC transporter permease [Brevibacillus marinus]|uniref:ABC transporter permease n=1 Tax=Brevibacillus marinus TaxID=2496837 RepID=UPI000F8187A3|nr:ABC transporter permease [Brevibacillus marinus]
MTAAKQVITYLNVFLFVVLLNFWLPRLLPGGPVDFLTGGEDSAVFMSEAQKQAMLAYYQLNQPVWEQFKQYLLGLATFDLGLSFTYKAPVFEVIFARLPWTVLLVGIATVLSIVLGLAAGLLSSWRHPGTTDRLLLLCMLILSAIPEFLIGMLLLLGFAVGWEVLPLSGARTPFFQPELWWERVWDLTKHALLPVATLTAGGLAGMYLLMRNEAIRVKGEPFVEFASAKGITGRAVLLRHVVRNAALPLVTMIVNRIGGLVAGAVLVETVFSYPGIGKLLQEAILARDYPLLHGLFLLITIVVLSLNLLADLLYPLLDPRIRPAKRGGQG